MAVQSRSDLNNNPFILSGQSLVRNNQTLLQDAGRVIPLAPFTVMAKILATGKWVPFTDETVVETGAAVPQGIFLGDAVTAADLVAGDVVGQTILVGGGLTYDDAQLVIENAKTLGTIVKATTAVDNTFAKTVGDLLEDKGMFAESTVDIASFET